MNATQARAANLKRAHECMVEAKGCLHAVAVTEDDEVAEMLAGVLAALMGTAQDISFAAQARARV